MQHASEVMAYITFTASLYFQTNVISNCYSCMTCIVWVFFWNRSYFSEMFLIQFSRCWHEYYCRIWDVAIFIIRLIDIFMIKIPYCTLNLSPDESEVWQISEMCLFWILIGVALYFRAHLWLMLWFLVWNEPFVLVVDFLSFMRGFETFSHANSF